MGYDSQKHPRLVEAEAWARAHSDLLARCFERFQENAEWPDLETLQLDFARSEQDIDVWVLAFDIPNALGFVEQQRLVLRVRCLRYLPAAAPLLIAWFSVLQTANRRWLSEAEESRLTREDVLRATHGDEDLALQVSQMLLREHWPFGGGRGGAKDPNWTRNVISDVRIVRDARTPEKLLIARDEREYPLPTVATDEPTKNSTPPETDVADWWQRFRSWGKEHYLGAVAAGLTVLIVWAFLSWGYSDLFGGNSGDEPSPQHKQVGPAAATKPSKEPAAGPGTIEEAGEGGARTYRDPYKLSQSGRSLSPFESVRVACRIHAPTIRSVMPDGNWYKILSPPWNGSYFAPAKGAHLN